MKKPNFKNLVYNHEETMRIRQMMANAKKIKITINIDDDILTEIRSVADKTGIPYQKLINQRLRQASAKEKVNEARLTRLEKEVAKLKKKLSA